MRIDCPHCGPRDSGEFNYLGDAAVRRPIAGAPGPDWEAYVYIRANPARPHRELWFHSDGCLAWLVVTRDVRDHAISGTELARP